MTWGQQNTEAEAHQQLSYAVHCGVNFIDVRPCRHGGRRAIRPSNPLSSSQTAEIYPVPPNGQTQGLTERYIGSWLRSQRREDLVLASKARWGWCLPLEQGAAAAAGGACDGRCQLPSKE